VLDMCFYLVVFLRHYVLLLLYHRCYLRPRLPCLLQDVHLWVVSLSQQWLCQLRESLLHLLQCHCLPLLCDRLQLCQRWLKPVLANDFKLPKWDLPGLCQQHLLSLCGTLPDLRIRWCDLFDLCIWLRACRNDVRHRLPSRLLL
jgi:hypothetical protein